MRVYRIPCGRGGGHGESCVEARLCDACAEIKRLGERHHALMVVFLNHLWHQGVAGPIVGEMMRVAGATAEEVKAATDEIHKMIGG